MFRRNNSPRQRPPLFSATSQVLEKMNRNKLTRRLCWLALLAGLSILLVMVGLWVARHLDERTRHYDYSAKMAFAPDRSVAFVTGNTPGAVAVLALKDNRQIDQFVVDDMVTGMVFHPDGSKVYVATWAGQPGQGVNVHVLDSASRKELSLIPVPGCAVGGIAISGDGNALTLASETEGSQCVVQIDTRSGKSAITLSIENVEIVYWGILAQDGCRVYLPVCSGCNSPFAHYHPPPVDHKPREFSIVVLSTDPKTEARHIPLPGLKPTYLFASADNAKIAVQAGNPRTGEMGVRLIDTASGAISGMIKAVAAGDLRVMGFSADSRTLYVTEAMTATAPLTLHLVDVAAKRITGSVPLQSTPDRVVGSPDGSQAYLLERDTSVQGRTRNRVGMVTVVDVRTRSIVTRVPLTGSFVHGLWELTADSVAFFRNIGKPAETDT